MEPLIRQALGKIFTPPPMPPEAMPAGLAGKAPGVQTAMQVAWDAMFYHTLTTGIVIGAVGMLAVIVGPMVRKNFAASLAGQLKGIADAHQ